MLRPYSVRTPQFEITSGGIRVMWGLYGWLLAKGQLAVINGTFTDKNFVAIYPEIYHGNDTDADIVVRYILQTVGVMGTNAQDGTFRKSPTEFEDSDRIYVFSKLYNDFKVPDRHLLFLPVINLHTFKIKKFLGGGKRDKTAFMIGKGVNQNKHPVNSFEITREFAQDQEALSRLLNQCHTVWIYDRLSALMDIARLCGANVKYYGDFTRKQLEKYETGINGLTFKDDLVNELEPKSFREHYMGMIDTFSKKLDLFIEDTQQ